MKSTTTTTTSSVERQENNQTEAQTDVPPSPTSNADVFTIKKFAVKNPDIERLEKLINLLQLRRK